MSLSSSSLLLPLLLFLLLGIPRPATLLLCAVHLSHPCFWASGVNCFYDLPTQADGHTDTHASFVCTCSLFLRERAIGVGVGVGVGRTICWCLRCISSRYRAPPRQPRPRLRFRFRLSRRQKTPSPSGFGQCILGLFQASRFHSSRMLACAASPSRQ